MKTHAFQKIRTDRIAVEAGRDAASLFRTKREKSVEQAIWLAQKLINFQCPADYKQFAANSFNENVADERVNASVCTTNSEIVVQLGTR